MSVSIGEISIPTDNQGFILLKCSLCGEFFKLHLEDYNAKDIIEFYCPCCGLKPDSLMIDDVIDLANKKVINFANELVYKEMKKWEKQFNGSFSLKIGNKPKNVEECPVRYSIDNLERVRYSCCNKEAKIKPIYKMCGSYCPFCGVRHEEN